MSPVESFDRAYFLPLMNSPQPSPNPPVVRKSFLAFALGLPIALLAIGAILMVFQYRQLKSLVSDTPAILDSIPVSKPEQERVLNRVSGFIEAQLQDSGAVTDTLRLNENEVNHLLRCTQAMGQNGETYRLKIEDSVLALTNVLPAIQLKGPVAWLIRLFHPKGWLNSEMRATAAFEKGRLNITLIQAKMNGKDVPVSSFNRDNRLDPRRMVADTSLFDAALQRLSGIQVTQGEALLIRAMK